MPLVGVVVYGKFYRGARGVTLVLVALWILVSMSASVVYRVVRHQRSLSIASEKGSFAYLPFPTVAGLPSQVGLPIGYYLA